MFQNKRVKECQKVARPCLEGRQPYRRLEEAEPCSSSTRTFGGLQSHPEPSKGLLHRGRSVKAVLVSERDHRAWAHHKGWLQMCRPQVQNLALLPGPPQGHQGNQKKRLGGGSGFRPVTCWGTSLHFWPHKIFYCSEKTERGKNAILLCLLDKDPNTDKRQKWAKCKLCGLFCFKVVQGKLQWLQNGGKAAQIKP